jgi:hypothetical protein
METGAFMISRDDGGDIDNGEFVSYTMYYLKWKRDYPNLKVRRPVEDICNICYMFAHRHKFFADHTMRHSSYYDDDDDEQDNIEEGGQDPDFVDELVRLTKRVDLNQPKCASDKVAEEREQMMLDAAEHIKMARAQRKLYQQKVDDVKRTVDRPHSERTYIFVVDYGQNMSLPIFNSQQPGATYYFSPRTVNNLGIVDHAHKYDDGKVGEHMHCHVYTMPSGGRVQTMWHPSS